MRRLLVLLALLLLPTSVFAAGTLVCQGGTCTGPLAPLTTANTWAALQTFSSGLTVSSGQVLVPNGSGTAPSYSFSSQTNSGLVSRAGYPAIVTIANRIMEWRDGAALGAVIAGTGKLQWTQSGDSGDTVDLVVLRDAANTLAQKNGTTAQEFRVYGTTTGSKYAALSHDGTNPILGSSSGALKMNSTAVTPATTGTRYLCIDTAGVVTSSASACSGT